MCCENFATLLYSKVFLLLTMHEPCREKGAGNFKVEANFAACHLGQHLVRQVISNRGNALVYPLRASGESKVKDHLEWYNFVDHFLNQGAPAEHKSAETPIGHESAVTKKDHFPLPFLDQVLERVAGHDYYCFLDGYSGYFQIAIALEDQEKTTFTCPFGTYAYRRMPFGLCNATATFQRRMLSIFSDMVERIMEVFMDDLTVYGRPLMIVS
ncbi:Transposon Ty3-I Gag-Pol polyprotein [Vitis vinifera]|uniref:Transposon Ty3-I Gag-Pol polyprotein n=1 Tax=Vitis vinifera TaxID=29760 RepID=A0A438GID9_VITVI|nr:Transposon Ty3-I Gag-Pol polyprotein [Vitis vinifera]